MRINIKPVKDLYDQHLVAEYREIKMLPKALCRSINSIKGVDWDNLPKDYKLNKGHGFFFYDKLGFIIKRFDELVEEMQNRGFETNSDKLFMDNYDYTPIHNIAKVRNIFKDYEPTEQGLYLNEERIELRVSERPNYYKYYGKLIGR